MLCASRTLRQAQCKRTALRLKTNERMLLSQTRSRWPGASASLLLGCLLFVTAQRCEAQNLVPNPSFELTDTCPYTIGFQEGDRPLYWLSWLQSPEYFHGCATNALVSVPQNGWGFQNAWDGNTYVGMLAYSMGDDFREYVGCVLAEPLVVGQQYHVSMRANLAINGNTWPSRVACDRLGMLFTIQPNEWNEIPGPDFGFRNFAHVYSDEIVPDTGNWTLISGRFIADSAYRYLVIGNFFDDSHTDTLNLTVGPTPGAYYYVDSVSVSPESTGIGVPEKDSAERILLDETFEELHFNWNAGQQAQMRLLDAVGRIVRYQDSKAGQVVWSIASLPNGVYVVDLKVNDERSILKFVQR